MADLGSGVKVFCGQRADAFFVDLGSVFDLGTLRPFQNLHLIPTAADDGVDSLAQANVHTIAIQVPIADLTRDGKVPADPMSPNAVIGVWGAASRQKATVRGRDRDSRDAGPWVQVSRLGNPLFNEVIVPMARKDEWNAVGPDRRPALRQVRGPARAGGAAAGALPGRVPEPGGAQQATGPTCWPSC